MKELNWTRVRGQNKRTEELLVSKIIIFWTNVSFWAQFFVISLLDFYAWHVASYVWDIYLYLAFLCPVFHLFLWSNLLRWQRNVLRFSGSFVRIISSTVDFPEPIVECMNCLIELFSTQFSKKLALTCNICSYSSMLKQSN